ncbi:MAG: hypothetical protein UHU19_13370 [Lachnospiraceae bacterium]|nr:hypothetical protein [Lachnospiraceae bacterium]
MWCPKCKTEYVDGITKCADCGINLVAELKPVSSEKLSAKTMERMEQEKEKKESMDTILHPKEGSHIFVDKRSQYEDMKSSAYTFFFVGIAGLILLVLVAFDVIPLHMASYMKIIMTIVMGSLFIFFLGIGIKSFQKTKSLASDAVIEENRTNEILSYFYEHETADTIDAAICDSSSMKKEQLYFHRYEIIKTALLQYSSDLSEDYTEDLIEKIYNNFFPES